MKKQLNRQEQLRDRANRYADRHSDALSANIAAGNGFEAGYRAALSDARRAAGKSGIPSALVKLLRPMR